MVNLIWSFTISVGFVLILNLISKWIGLKKIKRKIMNTNEYTTTPVMSIEDISISYGDNKYAVNPRRKDEEHSITAIMGPSGCGKNNSVAELSTTCMSFIRI